MPESAALGSRRPAELVLVGAYRVLERLGGGGMGDVYAGEHVRTGKPVAVKLARSDIGDDPRARQRFAREGRALSAVRSEHVVDVLDYGTLDNGAPFLVMERLHGEDLRALLLRTGRLPLVRALHIALDACRGLCALHEAGLVHRDLKPANLFLTQRDGGEELCKILDLGVAKRDTSAATLQGAVLGTIRYMAPEQLVDSTSVGPESDVYALAATLYECVTGRPPHAGDSIQALMFDILNRDPASVRSLVPELPAELEQLLTHGLARDPKRRIATAREFASALKQLLPHRSGRPDTVETAADESTSRPLPARAHRTLRATATVDGAGLCVAASSLAVGWWLGASNASSGQQLSAALARPLGWRLRSVRITNDRASAIVPLPEAAAPPPSAVPTVSTVSARGPATVRSARRPPQAQKTAEPRQSAEAVKREQIGGPNPYAEEPERAEGRGD